ncbi:hypothetical protein L1887_34178 [Cichorium endivia]|nr:hypothetical protein L1887_34178 [Cichorium endivia]
MVESVKFLRVSSNQSFKTVVSQFIEIQDENDRIVIPASDKKSIVFFYIKMHIHIAMVVPFFLLSCFRHDCVFHQPDLQRGPTEIGKTILSNLDEHVLDKKQRWEGGMMAMWREGNWKGRGSIGDASGDATGDASGDATGDAIGDASGDATGDAFVVITRKMNKKNKVFMGALKCEN